MAKPVSYTLHYREPRGTVSAIVVTAYSRRDALNESLNWCRCHGVQYLALWQSVLPIKHTQEIEQF